jgi:hypothetical protein
MANDRDRYWTQSTGSSTRTPQTGTFRDHPGRDRSDWIAHRARIVFGAYRHDDFADPELFIAQLGMILERYSDAIITEATSPLTGLQRACKFPPSINEAVQFCDELVRRSTYAAQWDERSRKQLEEREQFGRDAKAESPEHRAAVVARIKADLAKHGIDILEDQAQREARKTSGFRQFSDADLRAIYPPRAA